MNSREKILLILDLDETLIHATDRLLHRPPDHIIFNYNVYKRPYLDLFLESVFDYFEVAVWSSASDDYVQEIV